MPMVIWVEDTDNPTLNLVKDPLLYTSPEQLDPAYRVQGMETSRQTSQEQEGGFWTDRGSRNDPFSKPGVGTWTVWPESLAWIHGPQYSIPENVTLTARGGFIGQAQ